MRILLINPPIQDFFFTPQRAYSLGTLYLAAVLDLEGFEVKVLNALEGNKKTTLKIPQEFSYLKKYYQPNKSPFCLFSNYYHFGLTYPEIETEIKSFKPQVVGISSNFSAYFDCAYKVAQVAKNIDKRIIVVLGGRFPTVLPEFVLNHKPIDFIIRGEAELSLLRLCDNISKAKIHRIDGLCWKTKNKRHISSKISLVENLDSLPFPKRELINSSNYRFKGLISTSLISSRGCSFGCKFCAIGEKFRSRSAKNIFQEIEHCFTLGIRHFNFEDDNINLNPEFERILDLLIANFAGKIKVSFMNGLLALGLSRRLCAKLVKAGLTHIDLSLVSTKLALVRQTKRQEETKKIFSLAKYLTKYNIATTVHFIVALPYQSFTDCLSDLKLLAKKSLFLGQSIFYPVIESGFFRELKEKFSVKVDDYAFFRSSCAYFDKFMSRDKIFFVFYLSRVINFIKELIDMFSLKNSNFHSFLKEREEKFNIIDNILVSTKKIDRLSLGIILLNRLFKENKIFRVQEQKKDSGFHYFFQEEGFIGEKSLRRLIHALTVKGLFSKASIKIKRAHY
ncbi:MAG: cobalamin-dependent protein [Candidatus Omnitrophota bacterium]|nr:cobalamin-dependent protein [Candidatus Omnitrophota bacterium]